MGHRGHRALREGTECELRLQERRERVHEVQLVRSSFTLVLCGLCVLCGKVLEYVSAIADGLNSHLLLPRDS
jgi:hypothetical protein